MAESGGIGPRSSKGTAAYKAAPAAKQSPSGRAIKECLITARSAPAKEIGTGLYVVAQPHDEVSQRWGGAIYILVIVIRRFPRPRLR